MIRHYAPDFDTYLTSFPIEKNNQRRSIEDIDVSKEDVIIDFQGELASLKSRVGSYIDLSPEGDFEEAAYRLFDTLRWSETCQPNIRRILIADLEEIRSRAVQYELHKNDSTNNNSSPTQDHKAQPNYQNVGLADALLDRCMRAASGKHLQL